MGKNARASASVVGAGGPAALLEGYLLEGHLLEGHLLEGYLLEGYLLEGHLLEWYRGSCERQVAADLSGHSAQLVAELRLTEPAADSAADRLRHRPEDVAQEALWRHRGR